MRLVRLELFGFKSFKDKTVINFNQPITAIVGSNGCGKSNVVDALFWVMGDMSPKHLRGNSMTDVIFSGTRDVPPMDMAEVTLVLERQEGDAELPVQFQGSNEIQITRRYYRNGESEYLINKNICRLRDIQEFFMDTGLGAKAYSIIEQGYITRMVTQKPEERRLVIEEVAGIMKFKARRAETTRKIEATKANLQRIDDIVGDVQKQLINLKKQADKAEKHRQYTQDLRDLEIHVASREYLDRSQNRNTESSEVASLRTDLQSKELLLEETRQKVEIIQEQAVEVEQSLTEKRAQSRHVELALRDLQGHLNNLQTKMEAISQRKDADKRLIDQLSKRLEDIANELVRLEGDRGFQEARVNEFHELVSRAESEIAALKEQFELLNARVLEKRNLVHQEDLELTRLTQTLQGAQNQLSQINARKEAAERQLYALDAEIEAKESERLNTFGTLQGAFSTRKDLESETQQIQDQLSQLEASRNESQLQRDKVRHDLTQIRVRREHLEALHNNFEGVTAATKVLALHQRTQGLKNGLLADRVRVPDYLEKAFEGVLGTHLERLEMAQFSDVRQYLQILSQSESAEARTSRVPLWYSSMTQVQDNERNLKMYSPITVAHKDFVSVDGVEQEVTSYITLSVEEYLMQHESSLGLLQDLIEEEVQLDRLWLPLVKDVWVLRDLAALQEIVECLGGQLPCVFVTLDGDVLYPNGFLDLAPVERNPEQAKVALVHRKKEIQQLSELEAELAEKLVLAEADLERINAEYLESKNRFRELTSRLAALNPDVEKYTVLLSQVEAGLARLYEKKNLLAEEAQSLSRQSVDINAEIERTMQALQLVHGRKEDALRGLQQIEFDHETLREKLRDQESRLQDLNQSAKVADRALSDVQRQIATLEQERHSSIERQSQLQEDIARVEAEVEALRLEKERGEGDLLVQEQAMQAAKEAEQEEQARFETIRQALRQQQAALDELNRSVQQLASRVKDLEQSIAINGVELKNLNQRMQEQYQVDFESMAEQELRELAQIRDIEDFSDPEAIRKRIIDLKAKIDRLGKINMVAAEEFHDLSKRHEYLFIQRQDIRDSLSQLEDALKKINSESVTRFAEAFNAVNAAFQKTFPVLFGGGNAELRLTNPDDLLETGVEIVAQPPGKKLQSITLLSGGEKALTAVSLVFGIFSIKPSPFAVLDEVDAPLDDSNVGRFNYQIRQMSEKSQIIMITHKKKSMESADALFGVTMENAGISKVASARLADLTQSVN